MRAPQRLVWSEGMFMSPQHLQALDRYHEDLLANRLESLLPYNWGTLALEVDGAALGAGQLRIQRFAGVLPEGTPIAFDETDAVAPAPRPVAEHFPPAAHSLEVYLGVARERDGVAGYAQEGTENRSRYTIVSRPIEDATTVGAAIPVNFARPNVTILFGDESREDYDTMMVAELVRGPSGALALSENYVPPCLRINASPWLVSGVRDVVTRAIAKQRQLSEGRRDREQTNEITAPDVTHLLQLLTLNGAIPPLAHLAETAEASPEAAYLLLARLAGQLSAFQPGADPSSLPKFLFTDLRTTFQGLFARLEDLFSIMAVRRYAVVPLVLREANIFHAAFQDDRLLRGSQLILTVKSDLPEQQVVADLPRRCKIASSVDIQGLTTAVVSGIPIQVTYRPPPQIPIHQGLLYFVLTPSNDRYWQSVLTDRKLAIYLPAPFDPSRTKIELLAVPQTGVPVPPPQPVPQMAHPVMPQMQPSTAPGTIPAMPGMGRGPGRGPVK